MRVQCACGATTWARGRTRHPYFAIVRALLLFDGEFCGFFHIDDVAFSIFTEFHPFPPLFGPRPLV